jgi:hypothetical protein
MRRVFLSLFGLLPVSAVLVHGQWTVFDPSVFAKVTAQLVEMQHQLSQMIQTYQMITNQYNQMIWMARSIPVNMAVRYRAVLTPWYLASATNTYGTTGGWIAAINSGSSVASGYAQASEALLPYGAALSSVPSDQLSRLEKHYATIELTDGANQNDIETIGMLRAHAPEVEQAIQSLETDSLSNDPDYNTEIAVLNKINAANVIALRNEQDTNKLLAALAEQQLIQAKRERDSEVKAVNTQIQMLGEGQAILSAQSSAWTSAMADYHL